MGYSGFFRCSAVRAALAPRGHGHRPRSAALRCAGSRSAASAKQRALRAAFIARPPPHPSHGFACEGPSARKTLRRPRHLSLWPCNVNLTQCNILARLIRANDMPLLKSLRCMPFMYTGVDRWDAVRARTRLKAGFVRIVYTGMRHGPGPGMLLAGK